MKKKTSFEDACILRLVKTLRFFARVLPLSFLYAVARFSGSLVYFISARKQTAYRNLRAIFAGQKSNKELRLIAKRSMQNVCYTIIEMLRFPEYTLEDFHKSVHLIGEEKIKAHQDKKQGMIFLAAHFGNWEFLSIAGSMLGYSMVALAREQKHPKSNEYLNSIRSCKGTEIVKKGLALRQIIAALKKGRVIGILCDQDGGQSGVFVDFFGRTTSYPRGAARFAWAHQALIFPVFMFREGPNKHRIEVEGPILLQEGLDYGEEVERQTMQAFSTMLESKIRKDPSQWLWAHRRWKSSPDRKVILLSDAKAGHLNQSLAVLREIEKSHSKGGMPLKVTHKIIDIRYKSKVHKNIFTAFSMISFGNLPFGEFWLKFALEESCFKSILDHYADVVVSAGSSLWPVNLAVTKLNAAKSLVIMKPSLYSSSFDAVIVPRHDKMNASKNVFVTQNILNTVDSQILQQVGEKLIEQCKIEQGRLKVGVLIGGDTESYSYDLKIFEEKMTLLKQAAVDKNAVLLITTSRRTPDWAQSILENVFRDRVLCPFLVIANKDNPKDAMSAILGASDVLIVAAESMSMISEAVSSQKPVLVTEFGKASSLKEKHRYFIAGLEFSNLAALEKNKCFPDFFKDYQLGQNTMKARLVLESDQLVLQQALKRVI